MSQCFLFEGWEYALRPTCGAAGRERYRRQAGPRSVDEGLGNLGESRAASVSVFRFSEAVRGLSSCLVILPSVLELPEALRAPLPRDLCVPIAPHSSRLLFRHRSRRTQR